MNTFSIQILADVRLGAGFPLAAKKFKGLRIPPRVFFFCKHFGTGVLIATAFVHVSTDTAKGMRIPKYSHFQVTSHSLSVS
jgi:hypothetical protein